MDLQVDTNISQKHTSSIFSPKNTRIYLEVHIALQPRRPYCCYNLKYHTASICDYVSVHKLFCHLLTVQPNNSWLINNENGQIKRNICFRNITEQQVKIKITWQFQNIIRSEIWIKQWFLNGFVFYNFSHTKQ